MDSAKPTDGPEPITMSAHSSERDTVLDEDSSASDADQTATEIRRHIDHIDAQIEELRGQRTELVRQMAGVWARL